jgi:uncharacterized Zn-binding protein involved in type VI secretion
VPGPLVHVGATILCAHAGPATIVSSNARVLVSGQPVATVADQTLVAGCPFNVTGAPHPCVRVQWLTPALRVLVNGQPALLQTSTGLCLAADQAPQGPPVVAAAQPRVVGA